MNQRMVKYIYIILMKDILFMITWCQMEHFQKSFGFIPSIHGGEEPIEYVCMGVGWAFK